MIQRLKRHKSYLVTFGTEFSIMILGFLVFRIANQRFDELGFSEFNLMRRSVSFIQPLLMIGLGVAVPRYVSLHPDRKSYLPSSVILLFASVVVINGLFILFKNELADLFFGSSNYSVYIIPIGLLLTTYGFHAILYGYLRGQHNTYLSNLLQLINIGVLPIVILFLIDNILDLIYLNAILLGSSVIIFGLICLMHYGVDLTRSSLKKDCKDLLKYGLPRVLGDFALLALLTLPTYLILNLQNDILLGGDIAYSLTLLNIAGAALGPISLVLLPEVARLVSNQEVEGIRKRFKFFVALSLGGSILGYLVFYFFTEPILHILLGKEFRLELIYAARITLLGTFGYSIYIVLRSFLDAMKTKALNAINLFIALAVYTLGIVICWFNHFAWDYYLYCFVGAVSVLGVLTFLQTKSEIKKL